MSNLCNFSFWTLASTGKYIMVKNVIDIILSYRKFLNVYCSYSICLTNFLFRIDKRKYRTYFIAYMKTYTLMSKAKRTGALNSLDRSWTNILPTVCVTCVSILLCIFKYYNFIIRLKVAINQYDFIVAYSDGCSFTSRRIQRITARWVAR